MDDTAGTKPLESDRVLSGLFEEYVGGMYKDMGVERYGNYTFGSTP